MTRIELKLRAEVIKNEKTGKVHLSFKNPAYYHQQVNQLANDKYALVTIENARSKRSNNQNSYWHGVCFPILAELMSVNDTDAKELCVEDYILPKVIHIKGKEREIRRGTSGLSKSEGILFTDNIRQLAVELGGYIPTPCEAGYACGRKECDTCNPMTSEPRPTNYPQENAKADLF